MNKKALLIAAGMGIVIFLAAWNYSSIRFRSTPDNFLDRNSEAFHNYEEYSRLFPSSGETWVLIIDFQRSPTNADFLRVDSLTTRLDEMKGVDRCYNMASVRLTQRSAKGVVHKKILKLNDEVSFARSWFKLSRYPDVEHKFLSKDKKATCIYLEIDSLASEELAEQVRREVKAFDFPEVQYAGSKFFTLQARETMQKEMKMLGTIAAGVLLLVLFLLFRSLKSVLLTTFTLAFNVAIVYLIFWSTGHEINTLTFTVPMLITILSFSDLVHILYASGKIIDEEPWESQVRKVMWDLRVPLALTSLTTAFAFAVFLFSSVPEIIEFSWISCAGILWAYLSARYFFPELLIAVGRIRRPREWFVFLHRTVARSIQHSRNTMRFGLLAVLVALLVSVTRTEISYNPYRNASPELVGGPMMLNERFGGLRSVEVLLSDVETLDSTTFQKVEEIETYLLEKYGCSSVFSVNTVVRRLNRHRNYGFTRFYALPERYDTTFMDEFWRYRKELGLREAMSEDGRTLKIVGRLKEQGSADAMRRTEALDAWLKRRNWPEKVYVGGYSVLQDRSMYRVTEIILVGVFMSLLMAVLLGSLFYRNARLALALMLPNILPLLCALAGMEVFELSLDPFTAMSLSIIFGLSIDDTIYITGTYMEKRKLGLDLSESIRWNLFPVIATSLLLAIGFGIFALSDLPSTQSIGILVPVILLIAVLSDLFLLPALLKWGVKKAN